MLNEHVQVVVLAAGKGKRMGDNTSPKVLQQINGRPLVTFVLKDLEKIYHNFAPLIVVGHMAQEVKSVLGEEYAYVLQKEVLGTGHAVAVSKDFVTAPYVMVINGDMPLLGLNNYFTHLLEEVSLAGKTKVYITTSKVQSFGGMLASLGDYGRVVREASTGRVVKIVEKKDASKEELRILEVNPGLYVFHTEWLFSNIHKLKNKNAQGEYYLTDMVGLAISQGHEVKTIDMPPEQALGVNTIEQLRIVENVMMGK